MGVACSSGLNWRKLSRMRFCISTASVIGWATSWLMPNHAHLLAAFATAEAMREQCDSWLHYTAFRINQAIGEKGKLWQQEPFDHLVRNPAQYEYLREYIADNPRKGGFEAWRISLPPIRGLIVAFRCANAKGRDCRLSLRERAFCPWAGAPALSQGERRRYQGTFR